MYSLGRRDILRGIGMTAATIPFVTNAAATSAPEDFVQPGVNQIDIDGDGETQVNVVAARDPASGRGRVAHATSSGAATIDYVTTVRPLNVSLAEISDGATLTYEYYEAPGNSHAAPDEVWLFIQDENGDYHVIWHTANDNKGPSEPDGEWLKRNVHNEINGNPDPEDNPSHYWFELTSSGVESISDDIGDNHVADLVEVFGREATLLRLGAGVGATSGGESSIYFRDLRYDGKPRGNFPTNGGEAPGRGR